MVYAQPRVCPEDWDAENPLGFWDINRSSNLGQTTRPNHNQPVKENFAVLADHRVRLKEIKKKRPCQRIERNCRTWKWQWYQL